MNAMTIPPVFVVSTGRCGSTMISDVLSRHPDILSISEFFTFLDVGAFGRRRASGDWIWKRCSLPSPRMSVIARGEQFSELLYPVDDPNARFSRIDVPPIMCITLPHITDQFEDLYDELEVVVRSQPTQSPAAHFRQLFESLAKRFDRKVWVERGGGTLLWASRLLRHFPDARLIHVYRDGRETTVSMSRHPPVRDLAAISIQCRRYGVDLWSLMERLQAHDSLTAWAHRIGNRAINLDRLPWDKLTLPDFADLWNVMIETGHRTFGNYPSHRLLNVRFEDVQSDPEGQFRRLIQFISPELENEEWLREVATIPRPTPSKFAKLDGDVQRAITQACRPGLELLGYPV